MATIIGGAARLPRGSAQCESRHCLRSFRSLTTRPAKVGIPLVVRLEGTNVELGKKILKESGVAIIAADSMADAGQKIVAAARKAA